MGELLEQLEANLQQVTGYIYPNEVELHWGLLVVIYPYITGLVAGAFILASLEKVFRVKEVEPTYRLAMLTALAFLIVAPLPLLPIWGIRNGRSKSSSHPTSNRRWRCSVSSTPGT